MIKRLLKVASAILAASMLISLSAIFSGCNSSGSEKDGIVSAKSIWYDCKKITLDIPYEKEEVSMALIYSPVYCDGYIYAIVNGQRNVDINDPTISYSDFNINDIVKYDLDGNYISTIDIKNTSNMDFIQITSLSVQNNKVKASGIGSEMSAYAYYLIDPETDETTLHDFKLNLGNTDYVDNFINVGDYTIYIVVDSENESSYKAVIVKDDEVINEVDINKAAGKPFDYIDGFIAIDEETLLVSLCAKEKFSLLLSVSDGSVTATDNVINTNGYNFKASQSGINYAIDYTGIYEVGEDLTPESIMDFADTNVNISSLLDGEVTYVDDAQILTLNMDYSDETYSVGYAFVFEKADKNPNAGKKILDVYSLSGSLSYSESEAIVKFNNTSEDYFAKVSFANVLDKDDISDAELMNQLSDSLMIDLLSGDGPDVLLNAQGIEQFNNPDLFVDMSKYIDGSNGIDKSLYFDKLIEASKTNDGAIYQMPLCFGIEGIMALQIDVPEGKKGFTFDEFIPFVSDSCYGFNPFLGTQSDFVVASLSGGSIPYLDNSSVDFGCEEFVSAAKYAKENIFEKVEVEEGEDVFHLMNQPIGVDIKTSKDFMFWTVDFSKEVGIFGYPTCDASGPVANIISSVAISSSSDEATQNASWEFVKIMLDEDIQRTETYGMPINKAAFIEQSQNSIESINTSYNRLKELGYPESVINEFGFGFVEDFYVDDLFEIVVSIDNISSLDSSIEPIIIEELGAYFANQKSIDEVILIINNRVQTVIDERGN